MRPVSSETVPVAVVPCAKQKGARSGMFMCARERKIAKRARLAMTSSSQCISNGP